MYGRILELTRAMLEALRAKEIDRFAQLVSVREAAVADLSGGPDAAAADQLREIIRLDEQVGAMAALMRRELSQALQQIDVGREALSGYGRLGRGISHGFLDTRG